MLRYGSNEEKQPSSALPSFNTPPGNSTFLNQDSSGNLPISKEDTVSGSLAPRDSPLLCQPHMDAHVGNEMMLDNALLKDLGTYPSGMESHLTVHQRPQTQCSSSGQSSSMPNPTGTYIIHRVSPEVEAGDLPCPDRVQRTPPPGHTVAWVNRFTRHQTCHYIPLLQFP